MFYLLPENLSKKNLSLKGNEMKFIYLKKGETYTLHFKENTISKRMIKLSKKTINSKIIINDGTELSETKFDDFINLFNSLNMLIVSLILPSSKSFFSNNL